MMDRPSMAAVHDQVLQVAAANQDRVDGTIDRVAPQADPTGGVALRVEIDDEDPASGPGEIAGQVDHRRGLADPALLVRTGDDLAHSGALPVLFHVCLILAGSRISRRAVDQRAARCTDVLAADLSIGRVPRPILADDRFTWYLTVKQPAIGRTEPIPGTAWHARRPAPQAVAAPDATEPDPGAAPRTSVTSTPASWSGILVGEGHFGGDGRQPQVTLRMHVDHEALFRWLDGPVSRTAGCTAHTITPDVATTSGWPAARSCASG